MTLIRSYVVESRDLEPFVRVAKEMLAAHDDLEPIWRYLRAQGCDIGESIDVTVSITGKARQEAKWAVYHSTTWSDLYPANVRLHEDVEQALAQIAEEGSGAVQVKSEVSIESTP
jgi:hypothetical protein